MEQDNLTFNSVKTAHGTEINSGPLGIRGQVGVDEFGGVVNAVDIDWNEANLSSRVSSLNAPEGISHSTITTTGELLDEIAHLRAQVDALTSLVKGLYNALA